MRRLGPASSPTSRLIEGAPEAVPDEVAILAGILHAVGLLPRVLNRPAAECDALIARIGAPHGAAEGAGDAVAQVQSAIFTSVILPTIFRAI
jgi:hypothetical protein